MGGSNSITMKIVETERLLLRHLNTDDAEFVLTLLNEPSFLHYIGDKGVRTVQEARLYIANVVMASYEQQGFGLYLIALQDTPIPIGMCGLVKREGLDDVDIGYALLPAFWSKGYAVEAAAAVLKYGREVLGLPQIVAITSPDNDSSMRVLEKLGLKFAKMIQLPGIDGESRLFTPDD